MKIASKVQKHSFKFKFDAGTSRGVLREKDAWFLTLHFQSDPEIKGIGEVAPIWGLSKESETDILKYLDKAAQQFDLLNWPTDLPEALDFLFSQTFFQQACSSVRMGLEMAIRDLYQGGKKQVFNTDFYAGKMILPINGLIWMGTEEFMQEQVEQKIAQGYACLKMKIGAIDFDTEIKLLKSIRSRFSKEEMVLRVDANGAFTPQETLGKLEKLAALDIHSIEQPIKAGQWTEMRKLCKESPLPIALDEELIGVMSKERKIEMLESIQPPFIILKPSLMGGMKDSAEWIALAEERSIAWWNTSALESSLGLNAIAQFTSQYSIKIPQGLGTGQIYTNNFDSPLAIEKGFLKYHPENQHNWNIES